MSSSISGFTILNSAVSLGYPFRESILSLLPFVDEFIVNVGQTDDGTWEAVNGLDSPKIKPFRSEWNLEPTGGSVLTQQTDIALSRCRSEWLVHLQGDELLHEEDAPALIRSINRESPSDVEGLTFDYLHFFASPHVVIDDWRTFYPAAVRATRNLKGVISTDAGFAFRTRTGRIRGLVKARSGARIFHYGWSDFPTPKLERAKALTRLYSGEADLKASDLVPADLSSMRSLRYFSGTHPAVARAAIDARPRPKLGKPYVTGPALRAWLWFLASPRTRWPESRPFLPLWLTNLRWRRGR